MCLGLGLWDMLGVSVAELGGSSYKYTDYKFIMQGKGGIFNGDVSYLTW
jgi:hypothetical protein